MRLSRPSAVVFAAVMLGTVPAARAQAPRLVRGLVLATDSTPLADAVIAPLGRGS
jgi:hypothetical protein